MSTAKSISNIFNYSSPISHEQVNQRVFVDRSDWIDKVSSALLRDDVLIISGYSSTGKTTILNLATHSSRLRSLNVHFNNALTVFADDSVEADFLEGIYNEISNYVSGKKPEKITPGILARIIHTNQLLLIIDGINSIYENSQSSRKLYNLCKAWVDFPKRSTIQSKLILVASGHSFITDQWLDRVGSGKRLPREHLYISPWSESDLLGIIRVGSKHLGIAFDFELQRTMTKISCGLPAAMTLLASLTAKKANQEKDMLSTLKLTVHPDTLQSVFGESSKFKDVLLPHYNERIEHLTTPSLLVLFYVGIHLGTIKEEAVLSWLESIGYATFDIFSIQGDFIFVEWRGGVKYLTLYELSYGTFAFLNLYFRALINIPEAKTIKNVIEDLENLQHFSPEENNNMVSQDMTPFIPIVLEAMKFLFDEIGKWIDDIRKKSPEEPEFNVELPISRDNFSEIQSDPTKVLEYLSPINDVDIYEIERLVDQIRNHRKNYVDLETTSSDYGGNPPPEINRRMEREAENIERKTSRLEKLLSQIIRSK